MRRDAVLHFQEFLRSEKRSCKRSDSHPEQIRDVGDVVLPVVTRAEVAVGVKTDVVAQIDQRAETQGVKGIQGVGIHRVGIHNREITQSVVEDVQRGSANRGDSRGGSQRRDGGGRGRGAKSGGGRRGRNANQSPMEW